MTGDHRLNRQAAWFTLILAGGLLAVLAWWLVPWDWVPGGRLHPARPLDLLTEAQLARAEDYSEAVRPLSWASYFLSLLLALVLGLTPLGARLLGRLTAGRAWWLAVAVGTFVLLLLGRLLTLPLALAVREHNLAYGLTRQGLSGYLQDRALSLLVSWAATTTLLLLVLGLARRTPRWWFAWAGVGAGSVVFLFSFAYPVVVEPLFNRFEPMPSSELRAEILDLAAREGVPLDDVLVADASRRTTTLNAYVSGLGETRRVVVYDNLLREASPRETLTVVAHELGHARHRDVLLGTALGAVGAVAAVALLALLVDSPWVRRRAGVESAPDPRSVPLLLALIALGGFLTSPLQSTVSRAVEARADRAALAATDDAEAFLDLQRELAVHSLADPTPPAWSHFWFASHPTLLQRAGLPASLAEADR